MATSRKYHWAVPTNYGVKQGEQSKVETHKRLAKDTINSGTMGTNIRSYTVVAFSACATVAAACASKAA
jgi:hypothetical protein